MVDSEAAAKKCWLSCTSVCYFFLTTTGPLVTFLIHHPAYILDWLSLQSMENLSNLLQNWSQDGTWGRWVTAQPWAQFSASSTCSFFVFFELKLKSRAKKKCTFLNKCSREKLSCVNDFVFAAHRQKQEAAWLPWNEYLKVLPQRTRETLTQTPKRMPIAWHEVPHMCWQAHGAKICPDL